MHEKEYNRKMWPLEILLRTRRWEKGGGNRALMSTLVFSLVASLVHEFCHRFSHLHNGTDFAGKLLCVPLGSWSTLGKNRTKSMHSIHIVFIHFSIIAKTSD